MIINGTSNKLYLEQEKAYENREVKRMADEIYDLLMDMHYTQKMLSLELDVFGLFQMFYDKHKERFGSFRNLRGYVYDCKMDERHTYVMCCISDTFESKVAYDKQQRQEYDKHLELHKNLEYLDGLK